MNSESGTKPLRGGGRHFGKFFDRFVWSMAWRETRGSFRHFLSFFVCIALGVAGLVGVGGFAASLDSAILKEARNLIAGDLEIRSHRPLSPEALAVIRKDQGQGIRMTGVVELMAMAADAQGLSTQLVELKAVEEGYPFYGRVVTEPPSAFILLERSGAALVEESLLFHLGLAVGERIRIGQAELTIAGIIMKEPDRVAGAFSLGPRVMISKKDLAATGLIQPGSRVRYRTLFKLPAGSDVDKFKQGLEETLVRERVRIVSFHDAQPRLRRFLENLASYLGMAGLTALFVGGIGVANSVQVFLRGKMDTLAILKCLGAGSGTIFRVYLLQIVGMGLVGCLAGVVLGLGVQRLFPIFLAGFFPADLRGTLSVLPIARGVAMGLLTALLFSLWPIWKVREVPPSQIYRQDFALKESEAAIFSRGPWLATIAIVMGLTLLIFWQAGSLRLGGIFIGILAGSLFLLRVGAGLAIRTIKAVPLPRSSLWRHGLANLYRPGSQAKLVILSTGVGVTVVLSVLLVEASLLRQVRENIPENAPSFFFIDIQADQKDRFVQLLSKEGKTAEIIPVVRARIHSVEGTEVAEMDLEGRRDAWYFQREYVITAQQHLPEDNKVVRGRWWAGQGDLEQPEISLEEDAALHLGVDLGSTLTLDIQGLLITAAVTSIRDVDWGRMSTNFFIIFSPAALNNVPLTYIATVRSDPGEDAIIQRNVISALPNVTAINIRHVLEAVRQVLRKIGQAVWFMGTFTVGAGLVVLSSALAATRHWRTRESVILKTLGATRSRVGRGFAVEYTVLGMIAGLIGTLMASILAFVLLKFVMEVPWQVQPLLLISGIAGTIALTVGSGFLTTYRILGQKPLAVLRHE